MSTGEFNLPLVNTKTDRLYLATRDGGIMCLREIESEIPLLHQPIPQPVEEDANDTARPVAPATDEFSPPADDFADPIEPEPDVGEDPFDGSDPFDPGGDPFDVGDEPELEIVVKIILAIRPQLDQLVVPSPLSIDVAT